eukprot:357425-Chlamydomonas_euryale.AAC.7
MALVAAAFVAALAGVAGGSAPAGASRRPGHLRGYGRPAAVRRHLSRHVAPHARRATLSDVATSDEEDYIEPGKGTVFPYRMWVAAASGGVERRRGRGLGTGRQLGATCHAHAAPHAYVQSIGRIAAAPIPSRARRAPRRGGFVAGDISASAAAAAAVACAADLGACLRVVVCGLWGLCACRAHGAGRVYTGAQAQAASPHERSGRARPAAETPHGAAWPRVAARRPESPVDSCFAPVRVRLPCTHTGALLHNPCCLLLPAPLLQTNASNEHGSPDSTWTGCSLPKAANKLAQNSGTAPSPAQARPSATQQQPFKASQH